MLYYSLIYPYFYYCNIVWASTYKTNLRRLVILQKRIIRIINKSHFNAHTDPIFKDLGILKFNDIHLLQLGQFMYSCRNSFFSTTLRLKRKRPPPAVITVRGFKQFNTENFKADMEQTPFYIASVFDDMDDILWAWNQLFSGVCDSHAPLKEIKVRSVSSPWINTTIRLKMNRRFKLFKRGVETKDPNT